MMDISTEELVNLREQKWTDEKIAKHFTDNGRPISQQAVSIRLDRYYAKIGKEKPKSERKKSKNQTEISIEELVKLSDEGLSSYVIADKFTSQGKAISYQTVSRRLNEYYSSQGKEKPKTIRKKQEKKEKTSTKPSVKKEKNVSKPKNKVIITDDKMRAVLLNEVEFSVIKDEEKREILERLTKIKFLAEHSRRVDEEWIKDKEFLEIIKIIENGQTVRTRNKYLSYTKKYLIGNKVGLGEIDLIKNDVFKGNGNLMAYMLLRCNLNYGDEDGYDIRIWNKENKEYREKIDKYLNRLHSLEDKNKEKSGGNKESKEDKKNEEINPNPHDGR